MKKKALPEKTLWLWQIRVVMLTALLVAVCFRFARNFPFFKIIVVALASLCVIAVGIYLPVFFKGYELLFKSQAIIINYGVFIKFTHIMPYSRLIYAQSFATPLARLFGVTALSLKAARSRVIVPEMLLCDADALMKALSGEVTYDEEV